MVSFFPRPRGGGRKDDRLVISGIVYVKKNGLESTTLTALAATRIASLTKGDLASASALSEAGHHRSHFLTTDANNLVGLIILEPPNVGVNWLSPLDASDGTA